jgi:hypothetical protein
MDFKPQNYNSVCTFEKVLSRANAYIESLSNHNQEVLKDKLNHGAGDLKTKQELCMYLHSYGEIHQKKLLQLYNNLPKEVWKDNKISVVDYGCGQGIAEMVLSDYMSSKFIDNDTISDFTVIEPSYANLRLCEENISNFFIDSSITALNKSDRQIVTDDIRPKAKTVLHIFSNVIDLPDFDGDRIAEILNSDENHNNIIACVSPYYQEGGRGKKMYEFGEKLRKYNLVYKFEKHTDEWQNDYSCQIHIYSGIFVSNN